MFADVRGMAVAFAGSWAGNTNDNFQRFSIAESTGIFEVFYAVLMFIKTSTCGFC